MAARGARAAGGEALDHRVPGLGLTVDAVTNRNINSTNLLDRIVAAGGVAGTSTLTVAANGGANQVMTSGTVVAVLFSTGRNGASAGGGADEAANLDNNALFVYHPPTPAEANAPPLIETSSPRFVPAYIAPPSKNAPATKQPFPDAVLNFRPKVFPPSVEL